MKLSPGDLEKASFNDYKREITRGKASKREKQTDQIFIIDIMLKKCICLFIKFDYM